MSESDAEACTLLMGHSCHPSMSMSHSFVPCDVAQAKQPTNENESKSCVTTIAKHGFIITPNETTITIGDVEPINSKVDDASSELKEQIIYRRPRSGSEGLDYLAYLAEQERRVVLTNDSQQQRQRQQQQLDHPIDTSPKTNNCSHPPQSTSTKTVTNSTTHISSSSDSDDSEMMPPPQPRRPRSISNPDDMMLLSHQARRQHFVLPPHLLRKELLEARGAVVRKAAKDFMKSIHMSSNSSRTIVPRYVSSSSSSSISDGCRSSPTIPEHSVYIDDPQEHSPNDYSYFENELDEQCAASDDDYDDDDDDDHDNDDEGNGIDEDHMKCNDDDDVITETISSTELLRRARSRLLEDVLNESSNNYGNCNDKNIILLPHTLAKYKMVYNQNGRVGVYTPQERAAIIERYLNKRAHRNWNKKIRYNCRKSLADRRLRIKGRFVKRSIEYQHNDGSIQASDSTTLKNNANDDDDHNMMPDVNDPDAGFCPTIDQPYRRLRRHTVT